MKEEWRKIKDFPLYEVSNEGNVRKKYDFYFMAPNGKYRAYVYLQNGKKVMVGTYSTIHQANVACDAYVSQHHCAKRYKDIKPGEARARGGYLIVVLRDKKHKKTCRVHRLVAQQFIGDIPAGYVVNHKDYNVKNNNVNNLEICTQKENVRYSSQNMRKPKESKNKRKYIRHRQVSDKWEVCIRLYDFYYYGSFECESDAVIARDKALAEWSAHHEE